MTTNSDQAQPGSDQQQPQGTDQTPQQQPQATDQVTEPASVDIDQQAIDAAKAEVEAEKASGGQVDTSTGQQSGEGQAQQGQQQQDQSQPQPTGQQQPQGGDPPIMVPKARLDDALGKNDTLKQEAAYWRGMAEGRVPQQGGPQGTAPQQQQQPAQPTAEQRLAEIQTKQDALAKRFDDGEITFSELKKQERELNNSEQAIREEVLTAKLKPEQQAPARDPNDDAYLAERTADLETPMVKAFDQVATAIDYKYVKDLAVENLIARGVDPTKGSSGTLSLRTEMSSIIDRVGAAMVGDRLRAKGIAIPGQDGDQGQQQQGEAQPPLSQAAQQRQQKLNLAANAPPNLATMRGTTQDDGTPSDARIEQMSDDEIGNIPDATRRRLLGLTG